MNIYKGLAVEGDKKKKKKTFGIYEPGSVYK